MNIRTAGSASFALRLPQHNVFFFRPRNIFVGISHRCRCLLPLSSPDRLAFGPSFAGASKASHPGRAAEGQPLRGNAR